MTDTSVITWACKLQENLITQHTASVGILLQSSPLDPAKIEQHEVPLQASATTQIVRKADSPAFQRCVSWQRSTNSALTCTTCRPMMTCFHPLDKHMLLQVPHGRSLWQPQPVDGGFGGSLRMFAAAMPRGGGSSGWPPSVALQVISRSCWWGSNRGSPRIACEC